METEVSVSSILYVGLDVHKEASRLRLLKWA